MPLIESGVAEVARHAVYESPISPQRDLGLSIAAMLDHGPDNPARCAVSDCASCPSAIKRDKFDKLAITLGTGAIEADHCSIVVLDSRVVRRAYGETFLDALPCDVRHVRADDVAPAVEAWLR